MLLPQRPRRAAPAGIDVTPNHGAFYPHSTRAPMVQAHTVRDGRCASDDPDDSPDENLSVFQCSFANYINLQIGLTRL